MPVFFICFIVFLLWLRVKLKQQDKNETSNKDFWQREHEADFSRNKDISMLEYISVPKEVLPFNEQTNVLSSPDTERYIRCYVKKNDKSFRYDKH